MAELNCMSLNARGLRDGKKRREILRWLKRYYNAEKNFTFIQESHSSKEDELNWKSKWGSSIIYSHGTKDSKGVMILCPYDMQNFEIIDKWSDTDGRICMLKLKVGDDTFCLINVYAPTKNNQKLQLLFLDNLQNLITENEEASFIIAGDFNTYLDPTLDKCGGTFEPTSTFSKRLQQLMDNFQLSDVWRIHNPVTKRFTWRQSKPLVQSRLDYFLISINLMQNVKQCEIKPSIKTDHSLLSLKIKLKFGEKRGPGFWKFNASLLKDEIFIDYIKEIIAQLKHELKHMDNKALKWDYMKSEIRQRTIGYAKTQSQLKKAYENELKEKYNDLATKYADNNDNAVLLQIEEVKRDIENINKLKTEGCRLRSKANILEEQKNASYYSNKEKKNYKTCHITMLEDEKGNQINEPSNILEETKRFYEDLYAETENINDYDKYFLNNIPQLDKKLVDVGEEEITVEECGKALKKMKNGKTPGNDGLTVEFYKMFWSSIKDLVYESFLFAYDIGELSIDQKRGIIKLIPQKDKIIKFLKNWRPISLLNTDYKIIAHILAMRLQKILPSIIHPDQNGYIEGRFIGCNIRTIYDMIEMSQNQSPSNLITFIDYEKAFDNVKWNFLNKALKAFGFGEYFRKWIQVMYANVNSCVMNNGYSSAFFHLSKGIRQGCPMSALLFLIVVEVLAIHIRENKNIKGIMLNGNEVKITLLADDTTLFLKDITSLQITMNVMLMFKQCSGLKINKSKTQILQIGKKDWDIRCFNLKTAKDRIYTLGTWFYKDPNETNTVNYENKFLEFEGVLQYWKTRYLTLLERIRIVKTFALAKLNYTIASLEIKADFVQKVQKAIVDFIWNGKKPKIKSSVAYQDTEDGGLKIPLVELYVKANRVVWAKRLLCPKSRNKQYLIQFLPKLNFHHFLKCNYNPEDLPDIIPPFYYQVLHAWFNQKKEPQNSLEVRREYFIFNQHIGINKKYVHIPVLEKNNVLMIDNLVDEKGSFLSYEIFCQKYGRLINQFQHMSIIDAIPRKWRQMLKQQIFSPAVCSVDELPHCKMGLKEVNIYMVKSSDIYWFYINKSKNTATCVKSWNERIDVPENELFWKAVFLLPYKCTYNVKIRDIQTKIIHRFYPCQSIVSKWDKNTQSICSLCNQNTANITHTFYECMYAKEFWCKTEKWLTDINQDFKITLNCANVLLGILPYTFRSHSINHCILYAKLFIHLEKMNDKVPIFKHFLNFYKYEIEVEKELYIMRNEKNIFDKTFGKMYNACVALAV